MERVKPREIAAIWLDRKDLSPDERRAMIKTECDKYDNPESVTEWVRTLINMRIDK